MHDALVMRVLERLEHVDSSRRVASDMRPERLTMASSVSPGRNSMTITILAMLLEPVQRGDARMIQAGERDRLRAKALEQRRLREFRLQHLDRDHAIDQLVVGAEHGPHSPFAQLATMRKLPSV